MKKIGEIIELIFNLIIVFLMQSFIMFINALPWIIVIILMLLL